MIKPVNKFRRAYGLSEVAVKNYLQFLYALFAMTFTPFALGGWEMSPESEIYFVSIKNDSIGENNSFERIIGSINDSGQVKVSIDLTSVETGVDIRNERLQKMLFDVLNFPIATINASLSDSQIADLKTSDSARTEILTMEINLHGKTISKTAHFLVSNSGNAARITTTRPIIITAEEFGLEAGVAALQQIAGLNSISRSIPVTVDLQLYTD